MGNPRLGLENSPSDLPAAPGWEGCGSFITFPGLSHTSVPQEGALSVLLY